MILFCLDILTKETLIGAFAALVKDLNWQNFFIKVCVINTLKFKNFDIFKE